MKSALERIKEIEFSVDEIKKLPLEFRLMPRASFHIIKGYSWRCDPEGNTRSYSYDEEFLLKAFREMREIAVALSDLSCRGHDSEEGAECCDCPTLPLDHVDKRFEEKMSK